MHLICFNYLQLSEESCNCSLVCNCSPLTQYSAIVYSSTSCAIALSPRHLQCYFAIAQLHLCCLCWKTLQYLKYSAITNQCNISSVVKLESNHQLWCASYTTESDWNVLVLRNVKCFSNNWQIDTVLITVQIIGQIEMCNSWQITNYCRNRSLWNCERLTCPCEENEKCFCNNWQIAFVAITHTGCPKKNAT